MTLVNDWTLKLGAVLIDRVGPIKLVGIDLGSSEWRVADAPNPVGNDRLFGDDYVTPGEWTLAIDCTSVPGGASAEDAVAALSVEWNKFFPNNTMTKLYYRRAGVERFVYGRPRGLVPVPEKGIPDRLIHVQARFSLGDALHYSVDGGAVNMLFTPATTGGFTAPFTAPIITAATGETQGVIDSVGGNTRVPFVIKFTGPITNPWMEGDDWGIKLTTSIPVGMYITVDTRTYEIRRSDGANMSGAISRSTRLSRARLNPYGGEGITFGGTDATGTATALLSWFPAYTTL